MVYIEHAQRDVCRMREVRAGSLTLRSARMRPIRRNGAVGPYLAVAILPHDKPFRRRRYGYSVYKDQQICWRNPDAVVASPRLAQCEAHRRQQGPPYLRMC